MSTNLEYTEKEKVSENNFTFQQQQQRKLCAKKCVPLAKLLFFFPN